MQKHSHILQNIATIYEKAEKSKLSPRVFDELSEQLTVFSEYLQSTKEEAFFAAVIFSLNYEEPHVNIRSLKNHFDCSPVKVLSYNHIFESLRKKKLLKIERAQNAYGSSQKNDEYTIKSKVVDSIVAGQPIPKDTAASFDNPVRFMEAAYQLGKDLNEEEIEIHELIYEVEKIVNDHADMPLIRQLNELELGLEEIYYFLHLAWATAIIGQSGFNAMAMLDNWYENTSIKVVYLQTFIKGENSLIKHDLLELVNNEFVDDLELKVSENGKDLLQRNGVSLLSLPSTNKNITLPDQIIEKHLIYNNSEKEQIALLEKALEPDRLEQIQSRLTSKGLSKGIVALLHGEPGTGKTETAYQIAKATGRSIYHVDISDSKSMWFGESEKRIKKIFDNYRSVQKASELLPILLFNEADGILSRRLDIEISNVSRTENTIQNILLEELEKFEGILIATTNLTTNIDEAFERRFVFKIKISKPNKESLSKIWKMKFPSMDNSQAKELTEIFRFSGGQIDNILKKSTLQEVIHDENPSFEQIKKFCKEETLRTNRGDKVGF